MYTFQEICQEILDATKQWVREACPETPEEIERLDIIKRFEIVKLQLAMDNNDIIKARIVVEWICYHTPLPAYLFRHFEIMERNYDKEV